MYATDFSPITGESADIARLSVLWARFAHFSREVEPKNVFCVPSTLNRAARRQIGRNRRRIGDHADDLQPREILFRQHRQMVAPIDGGRVERASGDQIE